MSSYDLKDFKSTYHTLIKGAASSFVIKTFGAALAFISQVILARFMGENEYGVYTYIIAWITVLSIIAPLGINKTAIKFIPTYLADKCRQKLTAYIKWSIFLTLGTSILVALLTSIFSNIIYINSNQALLTAFIIGSFLIPLNAIIQLSAEIVRAFRRVIISDFANLILKPLLLIACITGWGITTDHAITANIAIIISITLSFIVIFLLYKSINTLSKPFYTIKNTHDYSDKYSWISTAIPLLFVASGNIILGRTDVIMLGIMTSTTDSGLYNAASRISELISFPLLAVNMILAPMISQLYSKKRSVDLQNIIYKAAWLSFILSIILSFFIFLLSGTFLNIFGASFISQEMTLNILLIGKIVSSIAGPAGYLLAMTNKQKNLAYIVLATALLNIILNYILIPLFGTTGAAIATLATISITNILMALIAITQLSINPTIFYFK